MSKFCFLFFLFLVVGCKNYTQTGDIPSDTRINAVKVGQHNKKDVSRLLGSPTSISLFEKESWIYIASKESRLAFMSEKEYDRQILVVTFKPDSSVESLKRYTLADAIEVPYDSEKTPSYGKDLSVWEEMVGNFGRFPANSNHTGER